MGLKLHTEIRDDILLKYIVVIELAMTTPYYTVVEYIEWCSEQFASRRNDIWDFYFHNNSVEFRFSKQSDRNWFLLRWS